MSTKKLQLIGTINADTLDGKHADEFCQINPTYTVTPDTLVDTLKSAEAGAVIQLSPDEYGLLELHGQDTYPEGLIIVGGDGATVAGVSITSGILSSDIIKDGTSDITNAILPSGLTFKGVTFTDSFSLRNARIDDLTIESCTFEGCNVFISPEGFVDSYGDDKGTGNTSTYRYPHSHLKQKNLTISNCTFNNAEGYQNVAKTSVASGIHVLGVENVTISGNNITGALDASQNAKIHDGIQIGGAKSSPFYVWSYGEIKVTMNTITNCRSRAINIRSINVGDTIVAGNKCFNTNTEGKLSEADINEEAIIVRNSENVVTSWTINGPMGNDFNLGFSNAWEGRKIVVGDGITVSNLTSPVEYIENMLNYDELKNEVSHKLNNIANSEEYNYTTATEADLEVWLEDIFNQMEDCSFRNLCIVCKEISDWPLMGTIHKRQYYATVDLTAQINGYHYIKIRNPNNGVNWMPINKKSIEQQIYERAYKSDLDGKMNEGVLIYDGKNDVDETGLNTWLEDTVMPSMANDTIRNISVRVGGKNGDGKGIIPWPALGTIHKRTSAYATIDVTAQINGKHYTKYRTDGKWSATACIEDKINLKADKSAMEAALANKADKADIENLSGNEVAIFDPSIEGGEDRPPVVMDWLDNKIIPSMTDNSIKYIYIPEAGFFYDTSAFNTLYELIGTVYKFDNNNIMINVFQADGTNIIKTKLNGAWKNPKNSQSVLNEKVSAVADVYKSVDDTDETKLNSWLETISDYSRGDSGEFLGMQDGSTKFISVNTPAVADGVLLWGTLYKHSYDSMTIDFISQEDGKRHIKIKTNGVWQDTLAISNSGQQDPGSNSETITNPQEMTEKELETWLEQEVLPIMADGSVRNISIRSSNLFDTYFGTSNDELGVGTIYKRDNDYVVLDLVSVFSGRHITKVKSPSSYPTYGPSDVGTGVWKPHMSITPYNYVNTKSECYTGEWDESKINDWLQNMGYDMTSNIAPPCMEYPTCVRNIEILHGPDNNRLIGTLYTYGLLDSDKIAHLTDYNTGKQYIKRRYQGVWEAMKEFGGGSSSDGVTEAQLEVRLQEAMSSFDQVDNTSDLDKPISTATHVALDAKIDKSLVSYYSNNDTDETNFNAWLDARLSEMAPGSFIGVKVNCYPAINGVTLFGMLYKHDATNLYATLTLHTYGFETYKKIKTNGNWLDAVALSDVAFTFNNGTLEIKTIFY